MRKLLTILCFAILVVGCKNLNKNEKKEIPNAQEIKQQVKPTKKKVLSPHATAMTMIGDAHIHMDYSSPGVRNRIIFGGLLSYDAVWQAGAHNATWLETNKDLVIAGKTLTAGKYGFFIIPSKEEWIVIFNTNWDQHGKDEYDTKDDVLRLKVKPIISETVTEHLEYKVKKVNNNEGSISLAWEKVSISFNFTIQK
ncbi:DUF2911 domain-containing protein [uncultured Polaribacter sp.]|jgi:hypothetical protein|uniref:DUF2911 domain-containing protein n=1 Tax=uncultured Polaribacter sp. TaxID=174711 RepID=UPI0030D93E34|tara:strand:- start:51 stop:638 length:588 start_codon:yes stop_codon:yes gene_type:complete